MTWSLFISWTLRWFVRKWRTSFPPPRSPTSASISEFDGASGDDEIFSTGASNGDYFGELVNTSATAPAPATVYATVPATPYATVPATASAPFSPSNGIQEISSFLNSPGFNNDTTATVSVSVSSYHSSPSVSELSDHIFNELFNEDSRTSTWTPGPPSASPSSSDTSSLSPSSPRKRTNNFTCGSPETNPRKRNRPSLDGDGCSKPNQNKKNNDGVISEQNSKMKNQKKEISETWEIIKRQDLWLAFQMGKEFDSVKSNVSEALVSHPFYQKIKQDEQVVDRKASELETFRKKNKDKRKEAIKLQNDVIKEQKDLLSWMKRLSQDLENKMKTKSGLCVYL